MYNFVIEFHRSWPRAMGGDWVSDWTRQMFCQSASRLQLTAYRSRSAAGVRIMKPLRPQLAVA